MVKLEEPEPGCATLEGGCPAAAGPNATLLFRGAGGEGRDREAAGVGGKGGGRGRWL